MHQGRQQHPATREDNVRSTAGGIRPVESGPRIEAVTVESSSAWRIFVLLVLVILLMAAAYYVGTLAAQAPLAAEPKSSAHISLNRAAFSIEAVHRVTNVMGQTANGWTCNYNVEITFRNRSQQTIKFFLPPLRTSYESAGRSTTKEKLFGGKPETIVLAPGESRQWSFERSTTINPSQMELLAEGFSLGTWTFAFGAPAGEAADDYIVGTEASTPIRWISALARSVPPPSGARSPQPPISKR